MKKTFFLSLLFVLLQQNLFSQESVLQGNIVDKKGNSLSYVNIGILGKTIGTVSDSSGNYQLHLKDIKVLEKDTLRFSSIGYDTRNFVVKEVSGMETLDVQLQKSDIELKEIVVTAYDRKSYTIGRDKTKTSRYVNFSISSAENQNLGSQIGRKFNLSANTPNYLQNFRFYISQNNFEKVKFRINVYAIKDGLPDKILNQENIIVEVENEKTGWVSIDLSAYDLTVKDNVIICTEWIEHSKNGHKLSLPVIFPSFGSTHYYKYGSQNSWKKFGTMSSAMILTYEK